MSFTGLSYFEHFMEVPNAVQRSAIDYVMRGDYVVTLGLYPPNAPRYHLSFCSCL
jgi:hypothetical protein